jgi:hypothetical protein
MAEARSPQAFFQPAQNCPCVVVGCSAHKMADGLLSGAFADIGHTVGRGHWLREALGAGRGGGRRSGMRGTGPDVFRRNDRAHPCYGTRRDGVDGADEAVRNGVAQDGRIQHAVALQIADELARLAHEKLEALNCCRCLRPFGEPMITPLVVLTPLLLNYAGNAAPIQVTAAQIGYAMETAERCGVVTLELENAIGRVLSRNPSFEPEMEIARGRLTARNARMTVNNCVGIQTTIKGLTDAVKRLERQQQRSSPKK